MKILFSVLALILNINNLQGQSQCDCFDRLRNLSRYYFSTGNDSLAIESLEDAITFIDSEYSGEYYFELGEDYYRIKEIDSTVTYFTKAVRWGYDLQYIREKYHRMDGRLNTERIRNYHLAQLSKIDFRTYDALKQAQALDQLPRNGTVLRDNTDTARCYRELVDTIYSRIDGNNFDLVKNLLEQYGYPSAYRLGFDPNGVLTLILHITAYNNENSKTLLKLLAKENELCRLPEKSFILLLLDRKQLYNTGKTCCGLLGTETYNKIADISQVDSIRLSYNDLRLWDAEQDKTVLPVHYKPAPYPDNYFCISKYKIK